MGHGGGYGGGRTTGGIARRRAQATTATSSYEAQANAYLRSRLTETQRRDQGETRKVIDAFVNRLNETIEGHADAVYGGSTAKGTFVEGVSDYDVLIRVQESELGGQGPHAALQRIRDAVRRAFPDAEVKIGNMAVTIKVDGKEIQALPALKRSDGTIRLPVPGRNAWSPATQPRKFADRLSAINQRHDGMVKQTIREFKMMQEKNLSQDARLIGYHVEAIAYLAFRSRKPRDTTHTRMLEDMTKAAAQLVKRPIVDQTGQNRHVDDNLGPAGSSARQAASHRLANLAKRMQRARESKEADEWRSIV